MMNKFRKFAAVSLISVIGCGVFTIPTQVNADWTDIFSGFGIGNNNQSTNQNQGYYDYNSTDSRSDGDIKMSKEVRVVGNSKYHDRITVYPGTLVEVWIEVRNTSSKKSASTVIRDEITGSTAYKKDSLRLNGHVSQPGLTSGGMRANILPNSKVEITYQLYICGSSNYPMRAYATAAGVGAATDAILIQTQTFNVGLYDDTYSCISQQQNASSNNGSVNYNQGNNTGSTSENPFGDWAGVNNLTSTNANNPFAGWTGVNNSNSTANTNNTGTSSSVNNPFGDWTGVNSSATNPEPFGAWTGVQSTNAGNPFGDWTGTSTSSPTDPFGDWYGTQNADSQFDMRGYSTTAYVSDAYANATSISANREMIASNSVVDNNQSINERVQNTNFVAPTTGVEKSAPFLFAGLLTLGLLAIRNRKLLFA